MIVVAIIGILAAIAVPSYQNYTMKAKFTEVMQSVSHVKLRIEGCYQKFGVLTSCDSESETGADLAGAAAGVNVNSVAIAATTAVITATGAASVLNSTYTLTPTETAGTLVWTEGGTCQTNGIC